MKTSLFALAMAKLGSFASIAPYLSRKRLVDANDGQNLNLLTLEKQ